MFAISVITVCYNSRRTIAETLHSVNRQSYQKVEHLIVDGCSTDGTMDVVREEGHRVVTCISEPDDGIYDAMNKGLQRSTGEVIGFLNADDYFADDQTLARVAVAFTDPAIEACFGDLIYVSEDARTVVRHWKSRPFRKGSFARGWSPAHPTFYIRRSALERCGLFDLQYRLAADAEFMMRYLEKGGVRSTYIPQVQVRMRVGGATNQSWRNIARQNREIFQALRKNQISHSMLGFWVSKLASRLRQRVAALFFGDNL